MLYVELLLSTIRKAASSLNRTEYWQNISVLVYWLKHILRHCKKPVAEKWLMLFYFLYEAFFLLGGGYTFWSRSLEEEGEVNGRVSIDKAWCSDIVKSLHYHIDNV